MLASISPFGERARGNRWALTAAAFAVGSVGTSTALGTALGALGGVAGHSRPALLIVAAAAAVAGLFDLSRVSVPTVRRQVDEDWLHRYRGWVYGAGFGAQLGLGVVTVVTTATVYAWMVAVVLSGSVLLGVAGGVGFGLARTVPVLAVRQVSDPGELRDRLRRLTSLRDCAHVATALLSVVIGVSCAVTAVGAAV
ncbi:MAG: hypothetical protein NVS3B21_08730 [Acidimicrobiales bacterium]